MLIRCYRMVMNPVRLFLFLSSVFTPNAYMSKAGSDMQAHMHFIINSRAVEKFKVHLHILHSFG